MKKSFGVFCKRTAAVIMSAALIFSIVDTDNFVVKATNKKSVEFTLETVEEGSIQSTEENETSETESFAEESSLEETESSSMTSECLSMIEKDTIDPDKTEVEGVAETFTIKFLGKDGEQIGDVITVDKGSSVTEDMYPVVPDVTGHTFVEWNAGEADLTNVQGDILISAVYEINEYTLKYSTNNGKGKVPSAFKVKYGDIVKLPTSDDVKLVRDGYTFEGWSIHKNPYGLSQSYINPVYDFGADFEMPASDVVLHAVWVKQATTDSYFYIRCDGNIPAEPHPFGTEEYMSEIKIEKNLKVQKYVFDRSGERVIANLERIPSVEEIRTVMPEYDPENQYILWYVIKNERIWHIDGVLCERAKVNLSYDPNCPVDEFSGVYPETQRCYPNKDLQVATMDGGVRAGYAFANWNTSADGTGEKFNPGDAIMMPADRVLYAQWVKIEIESETETETETESETQTETETESESQTQTETESETQTETETESETQSQTETESETQSQTETESETQTETESETQSQTETESETQSQTETESETQSQTETESETQSQTETESETQSQTETESESQTQTESESKPVKKPGSGDAPKTEEPSNTNSSSQVNTNQTTVVIADEATPLAAAPAQEEMSLMVIDDEQIPLADTVTIMDDDVPLADMPDTGDKSANPFPFAVAGLLALTGAVVICKKNKKEDNISN